MMRMHIRWATVAVVMVASVTAVAVAGGGASTSQPTASFNVTETKHKEKACTGADGTYRDVQADFAGTISSSDPRLAGKLTVHGDSLLNNGEQSGITTGTFVVRNATNNKMTFEGELVATNSAAGGGLLKGVITGHFPGSGDSRLVANFTSEFDSPTTAMGELGGMDNSVGGSSAAETGKDPAVIQQGHC